MNNKAHLRPKDYDSNGDIIPMACKEEKGDLIRRSKAIEELNYLKYIGYDNSGIMKLQNMEIQRCISVIEDVPAEDISGSEYFPYRTAYFNGVKDGEATAQGEWIEVDIKPMPYGGYTCNRKCNKCGYFTKEYRLNFCPNCGAKMQKGGAK